MQHLLPAADGHEPAGRWPHAPRPHAKGRTTRGGVGPDKKPRETPILDLGADAKPLVRRLCPMHETRRPAFQWWRGEDLNLRPWGYVLDVNWDWPAIVAPTPVVVAT